MTNFIIFWNEKYWPYDEPRDENDLKRLVTRFNKEGTAMDWWVFWAKEVRKGDRVFLKKTGKSPKGIIGEGFVVGDPSLRSWRGRQVPTVDVRFDKLIDPYVSLFLVPEREFIRIAGKTIFRKSGSKLGEETGEGLSAYISKHHAGFFKSPLGLQQQAIQEYNELITSLTETEKSRLVKQRICQDAFCKLQMTYWGSRCCLSGLAIPELLRASHIRAWSQSDHRQRMDVFNGFLLAAHLDAAFDRGLISVGLGGEILKSPRLDTTAIELLGLERTARIKNLQPKHQDYLMWHRTIHGYSSN